jgi:ATP-dependent helicase/nuclease subunit A
VTRQPPGCPAFGSDSVKDRPENAPRPLGSVVPGLHHPEAGPHSVVWWDPAQLNLGVQESVGLKQQRLLEVDEGGSRSTDSVRAHASWQEKRERVRAEARRPLLDVAVASEPEGGLGELTEELPPVRVEATTASSAGERPHGRRFGILVHTLLATIDLEAERAAVEAAAALQGRSLGAPRDEIDAAVDTVVAALGHPLLRRAAAAARRGACRRETPITLWLGAHKLVEGVVDAAFLEPDPEPCWTVIDFKTDLEIAGRLADYQRQVALYALAVRRATGLRAEGVLLRL